MFGTFVVFIFPALLHQKILAKDNLDLTINISLAVYGIVLATVILILIIIGWNKKQGGH